MNVLEAICKYKTTIMKLIIALTTIASYIYILKRLFISGGRNQLLLTIDLYSLTLISSIFCSEFLKKSICESITKNFPMIKNNSGRGVIYILISIIYMSPQVSSTNHHTKYFLLLSGLICFFIDFKQKSIISSAKNQVNNENSDKIVKNEITNESKTDTETNLEVEIVQKKEANPYDYPEF